MWVPPSRSPDVKLPEGVKAAYDNNYAIVSVLMPGGDDAAAE